MSSLLRLPSKAMDMGYRQEHAWLSSSLTERPAAGVDDRYPMAVWVQPLPYQHLLAPPRRPCVIRAGLHMTCWEGCLDI